LVRVFAVFDFRIGAEAAFDASQSIEGVVPVLAEGLGKAFDLGVDAVFDAKEEVSAHRCSRRF
jgi:hypothetical protein